MTVEALATDTGQPATESAVVINADPNPVGTDAPLSEDDQLESTWAKLHPQERVDRAENGKFVSQNGDTQTPLEGGEGEEQTADPATVTADVPLPANWRGLEDAWGKLPAELRGPIAEHEGKLHRTLSEQGSQLGMLKPLSEAASEFAEYFNGNLKDANGQPIHPADGIRYLANIQRQMDSDPVSTLLSIVETYGVRDQLAAALGVKAEPGAQPDPSNLLLAKIDRLERALQGVNDPSKIEEVVERREAIRSHQEEVGRLEKSKPHYDKIPQHRMVFFINEAWQALGDDATKQAVFDHAYNAAVEADPALRALSQAAKSAADDNAAKAEAAKRGNAVNVKTTATGKPRPQSEDEGMEEVWRKHHPQG